MNLALTKHHRHTANDSAINGAYQKRATVCRLEDADDLLAKHGRIGHAQRRASLVKITVNAPNSIVENRCRRSLLRELDDALIDGFLLFWFDSFESEFHKCNERKSA